MESFVYLPMLLACMEVSDNRLLFSQNEVRKVNKISFIIYTDWLCGNSYVVGANINIALVSMQRLE